MGMFVPRCYQKMQKLKGFHFSKYSEKNKSPRMLFVVLNKHT